MSPSKCSAWAANPGCDGEYWREQLASRRASSSLPSSKAAQPEPQRRPVAVARLGIEVVFVALAVAFALVVVMVRQRVFHWRKTSLRGCARIRAHTGYHFCIREACFSVAYGDGGFGLASDLSSHFAETTRRLFFSRRAAVFCRQSAYAPACGWLGACAACGSIAWQ